MKPNLHFGWFVGCGALALGSLSGCSSVGAADDEVLASTSTALRRTHREAVERGRSIWIEKTFGGEKLFSLIMPSPQFNQPIGIDLMLTTPRDTRFDEWGVVNDPDCEPGDASTYGFDKCEDPGSAGVVGVRKSPNPYFNPSAAISPQNTPYLIGVACAGCHAGLSAESPPEDPNHPTWDNVHLTIGSQYDQIGKMFGGHLPEQDPRKQVFNSWAPGTVDTTAIQNDGINNPGTITQFFEFDKRPYFDNHYFGQPINVHRGGQGGEDDVGCELATLRVYFNIGMCFQECTLPALAAGGPTNMEQCAEICPDLVDAQNAVEDACAFINDTRSTPAPSLARAPGGRHFVDRRVVGKGRKVFKSECASCHTSAGMNPAKEIWSDDGLFVATGFDPVNGEPEGGVGTHVCRSLSTNWQEGEIWEEFSSDEHKERGVGFIRTIPLAGAWATAPFFHNNRLGKYTGDPSVAGRIEAFEDAFEQLLNPSLRDFAGSIQRTSVQLTLPSGAVLPAGTPVNAFANVDPATGTNLCAEYVENGGHYFGAGLSDADKYALREFIKTL